MIPFSLLLRLSGLSQREASSFLQASPSAIDKMARDVRSTPPGIIAEMRDLISRQERAADEALDVLDGLDADVFELGYPADDHEAQSLGWPCVGAWSGMAARVIAGTDRTVKLVPRGSTLATAGAGDIREAN